MDSMPIIIAIITLLLGATMFDFEYALLLAPLAGLIVLFLQTKNKFRDQQNEISQLRTRLNELVSSAAKTETPETKPVSEVVDDTTLRPAQAQTKPDTTTVEKTVAPPAAIPPKPNSVAQDANLWGHVEQSPNAVDKLILGIRNLVWSYFTDGNLFVRIGLLILFFGVAFLLKYAAENSNLPIELRFMGAAFGGLILLVFGWRLRNNKSVYGLLLQGGGIGIIYITIFAAYQLANLLPSTLAFTLLVLFSMFTVALAVLQDSRALAVFAVAGGFLAPLLTSSGSGNYIGLFSYYTLLNAVVFIVAWYKTWRLLNLIGFVFTFAVYATWFVFSYKTMMLVPAMSFLLLFFVMYSLVGVLYALKQPEQLKGLVDGTLVFGTPVIVSSLIMAMLRHYEYGIAGASACLGLYYVLLARFLWQRGGDTLRLIAEAMLAIGVVFATIAIPYSLDGHWSSATWALEAAGILWVSIRQQRLYAQWFAILLQVGAGVLFLFRNAHDLGDTVWINPAFLGGIFVALGAFISSRILYQPHTNMRLLHIAFFIWAMGWWLFSALLQIDRYIEYSMIAALILFTATAAVLVYLDRKRNWQWMPASISAALLLPILILLSVTSMFDNEHVFVLPDIFFWAPALIACYQIIVLLETVDWPKLLNISAHTIYTVFLACLLAFELNWLVSDALAAIGQGYIAVLTLFPLFFMYASRIKLLPAIARYGEVLQFSILASLSFLLATWSIGVNFGNSGDPAPLPYLPFINPIDLAHIAWFVSLFRSFKITHRYNSEQGKLALTVIAGFAFIWITAVLIRSLHHYMSIPFDLSSMATDTRVQTAISILWTVIGMVVMLLASRRLLRKAWIAGAALIGIVLIKMFFVDLGASGTVERIVSFLVVGSLLVAMGYFSPIPEKQNGEETQTGESSNA